VSVAVEPSPHQLAPADGRGTGWSLWTRQMLAVLRIELRKTVFGRRSIPVYFLTALPIFAIAVMVLLHGPVDNPVTGTLGAARTAYSIIYHTLILGAVVFFGCAWFFTNLFRGEVLDRSLHYYLLAPVRREVLVAGKYLSGLLTTVALFGGATLVSYLLLYVPFGLERAIEDFTAGPGMSHLAAYLGVTVLACLGYGSLFLILGLLFRNPILPVAAVMLWEFLHFLLPPALKKASVIYYLKGLVPISLPDGPLAVVVEPPPAWVSVLGILALTGVALVIAALVLRTIEIRYSED
jgi:ABC-type transport system involved in multi-copper enzyme maturation permease subunit